MGQEYYKGDTGFEVIDVIEEYHLSFSLGNVCKYICRAGIKPGQSAEDDLNKSLVYLDYEVDRLVKLEKGEVTEPRCLIYPLHVSYVSEEISLAWGLTNHLRQALAGILKASSCRYNGAYKEAIKSLEKVIEDIVDALNELKER
tara:strand:+ start:3535 stop:3966 length:432 start_codon:yes stop_codon:yes gene_type:complete